MVKFLFVGDWHLRGNNPRNRTDDYPETAKLKLREVFKIAVDNAVDAILQPGDIFDRPEVGIAVLLDFAKVLKESPVDIYCTIGNHDIYGYNVDSYRRTSLQLLEYLVPQLHVIKSASDNPIYMAKGRYKVYLTATPYSKEMDINGYGYGPDVDYHDPEAIGVHIAHGMLLDHKPPFDRYSDLYRVDTKATVILTGHDHMGYGIYRRTADGKLFVNPGSLLRMSASVGEMTRPVQVALITIDEIKGTYDAEMVPLMTAKPGEDVLDRSRIEAEKERQYAMENFSALIQGHTGNKVLMDINQIIDQVAAEEKYSPEVVQTALQIIDSQREAVGV